MAQITASQAKKEIKTLMKSKKWADAHRLCLEILRYDPDNTRIIRMKNKIERRVRKINIQAIRQDLENLQPLWREGKYQELLEYLKKLEPYQSQYPKLAEIMAQAREEYRKQSLQKDAKSSQNELEKITALRKEKKYTEAFEAFQKVLPIRLQEKDFQKAKMALQQEWIDDELGKNKDLLKGNEFEKQLLFLGKLRKIDPESPKINHALLESKKRYEELEDTQKSARIQSAFQKVQTLLSLKKYDEALEGAQELLKAAPRNKKMQKVVRKIQKKVQKMTQQEIVKQMKKAKGTMKKDRSSNKDGYIKI